MKTIHLILNSHIDPVWLWRWPAGVDVVLNTCRSTCEILEEQSDLIYTCGEAWKYDRIEQLDPELFARIRRLIEQRRWEIVGGWWIQPDCNLPSGAGLRKQIVIGKEYFSRTFGQFPETAYNVDTFGHPATLPQLLREAGQSQYIMMRPQEHEMHLPGRVFRWRTPGTTHEVTTFRIAGSYGDFNDRRLEHFGMSLVGLPEGIEHTMCFMGVGDHGGGPSRRAIQWCRDHADAIVGARMVFSSPARFFAAIAADRARLPVYEGELQHHAIGCYSVTRQVKVALQRAEDALQLVEGIAASAPEKAQLNTAWRQVCFNQFHDILAGSSIPSACDDAAMELGAATAAADELLHSHLRRRRPRLGLDLHQRVVLWNAADVPFRGHVAYEPWSEGRSFSPGEWRLCDEQGATVPHQIMQSEAAVPPWLMTRLLFPIAIEPGAMRTLRLMPERSESDQAHGVRIIGQTICHANASLSRVALSVGEITLPLPRLELIEDLTDTWSHGIDRYSNEVLSIGTFDSLSFPDLGPVMCSRICHGYVGRSRVRVEYRIFAAEGRVELLLTIDWAEQHKVLKLTVEPPSNIVHRIDGIPAGELRRESDGRELPLQHFTTLQLSSGKGLGIACPDVFAADATPHRIRFTLLRSPLMAHHDPLPASDHHRPMFSDRGQHTFRFSFTTSAEDLAQIVGAYRHPPLLMEMTDGMPR